MKKTTLLLLLLFTINTCFSQIKVAGTLIDSVTHQPIQYSRISFGEPNNVILSDKNGFFEITYLKSGKLQISNVQYEPKEFSIKQNAELGTIYCTPQIYHLPPFVCSSNSSITIAGEYDPQKIIKRKSNRYFVRTVSSMIVSLLINKPAFYNENVYIDTLNYYIIDPSKKGFPFRVQVYEAIPNDDGTISHGKALIPENIILQYPEFEGWAQVDVKKYGIKIPKNGVFVSLEFLESLEIKPVLKNKIMRFEGSCILISDLVSKSNQDVRNKALHILYSNRSNNNPSQWTQSGRNFTGFNKGFTFFGDQYNFGFLNTGNPMIYINFSVE
jgi:hypothetical protein